MTTPPRDDGVDDEVPKDYGAEFPPEIEPELLEDEEGEDGEDGEEGEEGEEGAVGTEEGAEESGADGDGKPPGKAEEPEEEVKHPDTRVPSLKEMRAALDWAFEAEDDITPELLAAFAQHAVLVLEMNRVMNLTTILDPKEVASKHYVDCWRITRLVPLMARKVLDLGTGAGFPGIPLAIAEPNLSMTLVDSTKKKIDFVDKVIAKIGIPNAHTVWARAEDHLARNKVDVVIVRAVSSVRENVRTLRKVRHSLKDLVMLKAASWSREVRAGEREAERLGFKLDTVWEHELPGDMGSRAILVYRAPGGAGM
ncbi:MAG: 16S rRNA (guanine(527)-N(7))-methyltransferase RsmG [Planctomycetota bacterium]|nr:MAG: 16S rRNA (guanine(527)-N(7))-methyltransferase RsmG [Planctomycetota bacterium]